MPRPELPDQLRRYGEAVERLAADAVDAGARPPDVRSWPPPRRLLLAVAAVVAMLLGLTVLRPTGGDRSTDVVAVGPLADTTSSVPPPGTAPPTSTDPVVVGDATWTGGPDVRGELRVGACPVDEQRPACPGWQSALVAADGAFELVLPPSVSSGAWEIAAYVTVARDDCVFRCPWQGATVGPSSTVEPASPPARVRLAVEARVVDLVVGDRDGRPFDGGGVLLRDVRCPEPPCTDGLVAMFKQAAPVDGRVRVVVDPSRTYVVHGQALDTGWSDPQLTRDGHEYWTSPEFTTTGRGLRDGTVLRVDGAPD